MPGSMFYTRARLRAYRGFRRAGYSVPHSIEAMELATPSIVDQAVAEAGPDVVKAVAAMGEPPMVDDGKMGAIGDGSIIKAIEDFLASPLGQALEKALVALLLAAIGL